MKAYPIKKFPVWAFVIVGLGFFTNLAAREELQARLLGQGSHFSTRATKFMISIDSYTSPEEVFKLAEILYKGSYEAFMTAFRGINKGIIRPVGGRGIKINIHAAHSFPTEKGRKITLFMQRQSWDTEAQQRTDHRFTFMVFELNLDKRENGDGKIYEQAKIRLTPQGTIEMESYNSAPLQLWGVSLKK